MNYKRLHPLEGLPHALAALRIVTGYLFLLHGATKLLGFPHDPAFDNLQAWSLPWFAGVLELVGGVLMIVGLFTRTTAFVLSGEMAVAYFIGHASQGQALFPTLNHGEAAVLYCFIFLALVFTGPGSFSIDRLVHRPPRPTSRFIPRSQ